VLIVKAVCDEVAIIGPFGTFILVKAGIPPRMSLFELAVADTPYVVSIASTVDGLVATTVPVGVDITANVEGITVAVSNTIP